MSDRYPNIITTFILIRISYYVNKIDASISIHFTINILIAILLHIMCKLIDKKGIHDGTKKAIYDGTKENYTKYLFENFLEIFLVDFRLKKLYKK